MTRTISFLKTSVLAAGIALGPAHAQDVQPQGVPAQDQGATAEALITAQLQIEGSVDGSDAANIAARVVAALADQGYHVVEVSQTFLGRLRIVAESATNQREVIVSRSTGAVLRDRITATFDAGVTAGATANGSASVTGGVTDGITDGLTGGVSVDVGGNVGLDGSKGSSGSGASGSVNGSVSIGIGG